VRQHRTRGHIPEPPDLAVETIQTQSSR
jgi:hypothetical protein